MKAKKIRRLLLSKELRPGYTVRDMMKVVEKEMGCKLSSKDFLKTLDDTIKEHKNG